MSGFLSSGIVNVDTIPDDQVYLQDDWDDNKLTNREGSATVTYNGVEGVYRPEWTVSTQTVDAQNQQLELLDQSDLRTSINLNLSEIITWEWTSVDVSQSADGNNIFGLGLWADGTTIDAGRPINGYFVAIRPNGNVRLYDQGENILVGTTTAPTGSSAVDITVVRDPTVAGDPEFELFVDGSSIGTAQSANDPSTIDNISIARRSDESGVVYSVDQLKVS